MEGHQRRPQVLVGRRENAGHHPVHQLLVHAGVKLQHLADRQVRAIQRSPELFDPFAKLCAGGEIHIGDVHVREGHSPVPGDDLLEVIVELVADVREFVEHILGPLGADVEGGDASLQLNVVDDGAHLNVVRNALLHGLGSVQADAAVDEDVGVLRNESHHGNQGDAQDELSHPLTTWNIRRSV